jgi:hypothetical protein
MSVNVKKSTWAIALSLACSATGLAQWSSDANVNTPIAVKSGEQVQSKVRATADGGCYIAWYDNETGGYDMYIQRLDPQGYKLFPPAGLQVADLSFSSTQDYGFGVDGADHAYLAFRDDRYAGQQVTANVIAPDGTLVWGSAGVQLADSMNGNAPHLAATSTGVVVGWTLSPPVRLQKLDAAGVPLWGAGIVEQPSGSYTYTLCELQPSEDGGVIASWVRGGGYTTPRHLYTQKYDAAGNRLWNGGSPRVVFDGGSLQLGYFPTFSTDGNGGAVFSWYDTGGSRHAYVQHIDAAGSEAFPHNGVTVNTTANRIRLVPSHAHNPITGDTFVFWTETNSGQSQWGVYGQQITAAGARGWGVGGLQVTALDGQQEAFVNTLSFLDGAQVFWFDNSGIGRVLGARVSAAGTFLWIPPIIQPCSLLSDKSRLDATCTPSGTALLTWGDGRSDARDVYAQNVNPPDGSLGLPIFLHADLNCDGVVDFDDINPFVLAISDPGAYETQYPDCFWLAGDCDSDGDVDFDDINAFVALLSSGAP